MDYRFASSPGASWSVASSHPQATPERPRMVSGISHTPSPGAAARPRPLSSGSGMAHQPQGPHLESGSASRYPSSSHRAEDEILRSRFGTDAASTHFLATRTWGDNMGNTSSSDNNNSSSNSKDGLNGNLKMYEPSTVSTPSNPTTGPAKKRGRPKGWRAGMSYHELRGEPPGSITRAKPPRPKPRTTGSATPSDPSQQPKRRGRRPRSQLKLAAIRRQVYDGLRPKFLEFVCEWHGCKARLHNADTLFRHVDIVHGQRQLEEPRVCLWEGCGQEHGMVDGYAGANGDDAEQKPSIDASAKTTPGKPAAAESKPTHQPKTFPTLDAFTTHMHDEHLDHVRRVMGDGPHVRPDGGYPAPDITRFLVDRDGQMLVPLVGELEDAIEDESARRARKAALKRLLQKRDDNAPAEMEYEDDMDELVASLGEATELGG